MGKYLNVMKQICVPQCLETRCCFCLSWRVLTLRLGDGLNGDSCDSYCPQLHALPLSWKSLSSCSRHNWTLRESSFILPDFTPASAHANPTTHKLPWLGGEFMSRWTMARWKRLRKKGGGQLKVVIFCLSPCHGPLNRWQPVDHFLLFLEIQTCLTRGTHCHKPPTRRKGKISSGKKNTLPAFS